MSIRSRLNDRLATQRYQPTTVIPVSIRRLVRRISGGEEAGAQLLRGLAWKFRTFLFLSVLANVIAAVFEGGTMAIFTAALEYAAGSRETLDQLGTVSTIIQTFEMRFGTGGVFGGLVGIAVLMQIGRSWFDFSAQSAAAYLRAWSEGDLRRRIFTQFTTITYANISKYRVGDLSSFVGEVTRVGNLITFTNHLLGHITIICAYTIILLWLSWQLTLTAIAGVLILSFSLRSIRRRVRQRSQGFMRAYVSINSRIVEFLGGMRLLHTFHRQRYARESIEATINDSILARRQAMMLAASVPAIVQSLTIIGVALFLTFGYLTVQRTDDLTLIPRLVTFVFIVYRMLPRVTGINTALAKINEEYPFATRLATHLRTDDKQYLQSGTHSFQQLNKQITLENVTLRYPDTQQDALAGVSLTIDRGDMVAFVGESGSGKSSIVSLFLRLYDATSGQILIDGISVEQLKRDDWLGRIGVVDQETFVLHTTVRENLRFGRFDATDVQIEQAAKVANAHNFIMELRDGYDTIVGDRGLRLSGGQRQRLAIARAILRDPDILILDEATSALDSQSERLIQDSVESLRNERTIIVVAHRLSTIARADKIFVLHKGKVVEVGSHTELLALQGRYNSMWKLQR